MSGTSLDGLDICYASFTKNENAIWKFEILKAETFPYSKQWETKLLKSLNDNAMDLCELNSEYGFYLGEEVQKFLQNNSIEKIDVIASHGHTVFHQPKKKYTLQIGDGRAIKILNNYPVVYDFRSQDVLLGGNGAPLVPIGDELLFSDYDACLNMGGFSNISMRLEGKRIAFDICPVNIVSNHYAEKLNKKYDEDGGIAKSGNVNLEVLKKLNHLKFYQETGPKSLGREWVLKEIFPMLDDLNIEDALATITEHAADKIAEVLNLYNLKNVLFTGGGAYNSYLISKIREKTNTSIIIPEKTIIDFKEALIFAFMGVLRILNEINVLSSATGSSKDHCTGILV